MNSNEPYTKEEWISCMDRLRLVLDQDEVERFLTYSRFMRNHPSSDGANASNCVTTALLCGSIDSLTRAVMSLKATIGIESVLLREAIEDIDESIRISANIDADYERE